METTEIIARAAQAWNITAADITGNSRRRQCVEARHAAMYLIFMYTDANVVKTGQAVNRSHCLVNYAIIRVADWLGRPWYREQRARVEALAREIKNEKIKTA